MKSEDKVSEELEEQSKMLKVLVEMPEFQLWRELWVKPVLEECKQARQQCLVLDETNLKAILLYENKIEDLFNRMFESNV